jgi:protein-S-isoprenylcysteine O-methyltransferase Ste14
MSPGDGTYQFLTHWRSEVYSLGLAVVFAGMIADYTRWRQDRRYARGKTRAVSVRFRHLSKILFFFSMLVTLASFWTTSVYLLPMHRSSALAYLGVFVVWLGWFIIRGAMSRLDHNYSPLFDAYLPVYIVREGQYRYIRHPVYLGNLLVSFGLVVSSGSALVLGSALVGLYYILKTIPIEETYLHFHFPEYVDYKKRTWRLIPFLF